MYFNTRSFQLGALAFALPSLCLPGPVASPPASEKPESLKPIRVANFESAFGIQRRATQDLSDLNLQTQEQLIYGRPGSSSNPPLSRESTADR